MTKEPASPGQLNWVRTETGHHETILLIHAVGQDLTYWDRQIEALSDRYNVVALDLPGHGRSSAALEPWSFDYAARVVAGLIEQLDVAPVHLVGLSFGGMVAQATTLARPDLVRSLVLIGTASSFPDEVRKGMNARAQLVRSNGMAAVVESTLQRWFTRQTAQRRPDIIDRITKTLLSDDAATHAEIWDIIANLNFDDRLSEVQCPTLVLVGEQDPSTPPAVAAGLASRIPNAKMVVIPDASHIVTVEAPEAVNVALRGFLGGARI
jgi:3-oxoadipate enol-lactonase